MKSSNRWWVACVSGLVCAIGLFAYDFSDRGPRFMTAPAQAKTDRSGLHDLGRARMLNKVVGHIRSHYVDPERVLAPEMAVAALQAIQARVPEVLVSVERDKKNTPNAISTSVGDKSERFELNRVGDLYELSWKLMDVFRFLQRHLPPATDLEDVEYAAVNGLLSTLDPHSVLLTPQVYREMQLGTHGKFGGLGIVISIRDGVLTVMSVMDGTPAYRAGLKSGDKILQIGEESSVNMKLSEAVNRLRGEPGSQVSIQIRREGHGDLLSFKITREEIRVRAVDHHSLEEGLGYIRIRTFQGNTFDDLNEAMDALSKRDEGLKGLVLDLRENPGGLLDQAIKVSDRFLTQGTIVSTVREGSRQREERHATSAGTSETLPVVVLINRGSASASEIVAGALKHNQRALVVGSTSFGKGSVQVLYQIDDAALKLTIAQYLTPGDISIQSVGIKPDIEIQRVTARKTAMDLFPDELGYKGEAGLESHLDSDKTTSEESAVRFRLVESDEDKDKDKDKDTPVEKDAGKEEAFEPDSLVSLAMDILKAAPVADRSTAMVQASGLLKRRQKEEDTSLQAKLEAMDVDWTNGAQKTRASLEVSLSVRAADEPGRTQLMAGDKVKIEGKIRNKGKRDAYRLHGVLDSQIRALNALELVFGRVPAGEERSWSTTATLSRSMSSQADEVTLKILQNGEELKPRGVAVVQVLALPAPRFAASYVVVDPEGNGDSLVQRKETISLAVRVTNVGEGTAESVLASVKNESGESVYIRSGRKKLGEIPKGKSAVAVFQMEVREGLRSQDVQLELSVVDQERGSWLRSPLSLPAFPADFPAADKATGWVSPSDGTIQVHAGAHQDTPVIATMDSDVIVPLSGTAGHWL
ncbi:MAG: MXAN_5808 family serine peptidase, partial [Myxococcota bacterium]|nr:MXAN_5808 family serine peptidase [Myxococcota bacterium]